jgi:type I restriction enzyme S subunit
MSTVRPDRAAFFLADSPPENLIASTGFAVLTSKQPNDALFGHVAVTMSEFFDELGRLADGGAYPAIRADVVLSRPLIIATQEVRYRFHQLVEPLIALIKANQQENKTLGLTRNLLLPRLLSGEITISEAVA